MTLIQGVTDYWARTLGIHSRDLGCGHRVNDQGRVVDNQASHPQMDDVVILIKFIQEYQRDFSAKQRVAVYVMWDWCYCQRRPLTRQYLKAIERTIYRIRHIRNLRAQATRRSTARLKARYHNTAK